MAEIPFTMYSGAGNLFVIVDAFTNPTVFGKVKLKALAQTVANRKGPIGSDGLIVLGRSGRAPFMMNFYNPDGSFGALCGNGARCAVQAALDFGVIASADTNFEVLGELVRAERPTESTLKVYYNDPKKIKLKFKLALGGELVNCSYVDLGSQHGIIFFDEVEAFKGKSIEDFDINTYGQAVRLHKDFEPLGVNASFAQVMKDDEGEYIRIRTYERGVEGETLACGTGCMSTAIAAYGLKKVSRLPIRLKTQSGEFVEVNFSVASDGHISELSLEGSAVRGKSGILTISD
ncbi:MAG: diaminopimelate epimerase [Bacteroidota bacterium]|nr:diaminopimelate epimerase [Bacteroidota bacterium]MDP4236596.1 diaminopimelate epimerase [Bacteroidota bacterium]